MRRESTCFKHLLRERCFHYRDTIFDGSGVTPKQFLPIHCREDTALSFNGGKDCTVVLHLLRAACLIKDQQMERGEEGDLPWLQRVKFVHFVKPNEFPEIEQFRS